MSSLQTTLVLAISLALSTIVSAESVIGKKYNSAEIANQNIGNNYVTELDRSGHVSRVIVTGENGSGTDNKSVVNKKVTTEVQIQVPDSYSGQEAIDFLGSDIVKVAERSQMDVGTLKNQLLTDSTIHVDANGFLFVVDKGLTDEIVSSSTVGSSDPITVPLSPELDVFALHSNKNAKVKIYLDMDGETVPSSSWSANPIVAAPYVNPTTKDGTERQLVYFLWSTVSEDYIGMNVDVTTEKPLAGQLSRDIDTYDTIDGSLLTRDYEYGIHVVITPTYTINCGCGGIAYIGAMGRQGSDSMNVAWVFTGSPSSIKSRSEAASHEVGHTVGLYHDGIMGGVEYYAGHDDWAPIMGVGYYKSITQFSKGEYPNANNKQDDFLVMAAHGLTTREDDVGDTKETATTLHASEMQSTGLKNISNYGVIETRNDVDMYVMNVMSGPLKIEVKGLADLNPKVTLLDADGKSVGTVLDKDSLHNYTPLQKTIDEDVVEGVYYLKVESSNSVRADGTESYSTYGSIGQYSITGSFAAVERPIPHAVLECTILSGYVPFQTHCSAAKSTGGQLTYSWGNGAEIDLQIWDVGKTPEELTVTNEYGLTDKTKVIFTGIPVLNPKSVMHVKAVIVSVVTSGKKNMYGKTIVTVVDNRGKPVSGAVVAGVFDGVFTNSVTAKTNAAGQAVFKTAVVPNFSGTVAFKVMNMSKVNVTYNPLLNVVDAGAFWK